MNKIERLFFYREFVNSEEDGGSGYIKAVVEVGERAFDSDGLFEIGDCSRRAAFNFPLYSASDRRNSLEKAHKLQYAASCFLMAVDKAHRKAIQIAWDERKKRRAEKENQCKVTLVDKPGV